MALTYDSLLRRLQQMTPAQLATDVTVYDANNDETLIVDDVAISGQEDEDDIRPESDVLDDGQPYLMIGLC